MRKLDLGSSNLKFLEDLPPKQFRQIMSKVLQLLTQPTPSDAKLLTGYPYHRIDAGEYRVVYRFDAETVFIVLVGKRNDDEVYKALRRKER